MQVGHILRFAISAKQPHPSQLQGLSGIRAGICRKHSRVSYRARNELAVFASPLLATAIHYGIAIEIDVCARIKRE